MATGTINGNGQRLPSKRIQHVEEEPSTAELMELPPWLKSLRDAMSGAINADDLREIVSAQVEKAKKGDVGAASFVMGQAHKLLQAGQKRVTVVQNNYYGAADEQRPDVPAKSRGGTPEKLDKMARRAQAGLPLTDDADGPRPMSDAEEKEFRRRQAEEAAE